MSIEFNVSEIYGPANCVWQLSEDRANRGLLSMSEVLEDIEYREQSTSMPSSLEARSFLPGLQTVHDF